MWAAVQDSAGQGTAENSQSWQGRRECKGRMRRSASFFCSFIFGGQDRGQSRTPRPFSRPLLRCLKLQKHGPSDKPSGDDCLQATLSSSEICLLFYPWLFSAPTATLAGGNRLCRVSRLQAVCLGQSEARGIGCQSTSTATQPAQAAGEFQLGVRCSPHSTMTKIAASPFPLPNPADAMAFIDQSTAAPVPPHFFNDRTGDGSS